MKVIFISVNHNQNVYIKQLLEDVLKYDPIAEFICVNNGSERFSILNQRAYILDVPNQGYLHGLRSGFNFIESEGISDDPSDIIVLCNPDIRLSENFFIDLKRKESICSNVWVIAPDIEEVKTGKKLNPNMNKKMSYLLFIINTIEMYSYLTFRIIRALKVARSKLKGLLKIRQTENLKRNKIFAPHGSLMITNRHSINQSGMLNYPIFLWGEEVCIAHSIRENNGHIIFDPSIKVFHDEHTSTSKIPSRTLFDIWSNSFSFYKRYLR